MPTDIIEDAVAENLVQDAAAAPSMHNAQPWTFRFHRTGQSLELRADPGRVMPSSDPDNRALHVGCGAALLNLRAAAAWRGLSPVVELLPDPSDPGLLAVLRFGPARGGEAEPELAGLHGAIADRRTSRHPFSDRPVPQAVREELAAEARQEGASLTFPAGWHLSFVLELIDEAELEAGYRGDPDEERWLRLQDAEPGAAAPAQDAQDGVQEESLGPMRDAGRAPVRDFARRHPVAGRGSADFERIPQLGIVSTREDGPRCWLGGGAAMERVLLGATRAGLATALATQALEQPNLRWMLRDPSGAEGPVQMVLRLGYGPPGPASPRRPVRDVLEILP
ncbi:nitroreductase [Streptomyces sp. HNM0575]|uniref:Acg family FMN-binding oxidoreductase n=1 Tax=Streptomyces sp. HNM0575 TaxID=2716338 RepID=UPI00145CE30F|nr:nitroreductase family protein [Streptomyces sp. HNM0575]NLU76041.1 nitroreductase [Streptomyces sp. HNM0575]